MEPSFNWLAILLLVGAAHALLLAVTLFNIRGGNQQANRILALLLIVFVVLIGHHVLTQTRLLLKLPQLSKVTSPIVFLLPPLFYFYVQALTSNRVRLEKKALLHFIPFLLAVAYLMPHYLGSTDYKIAHIMEDYQGTCMLCHINYWFSIVQMLVYMIFILNMLVAHSQRIKDLFSSVERINLKWLKGLFVAFSLTWVLSLLLQLFSTDQDAASYIWLAVSIDIYLIGYLGLRQPVIFAGINGMMTSAVNEPKRKYERSTLRPEKAEEYLVKLNRFMESEKPFLDGDLTLQQLAKKISVSSHHLSQIVNEKLNQNFFEFINSHRIEEAKKLLADPENRNVNIAEIGFEAGFNSISTFNTAFKKHAQMTPSQYFEQAASK